MLTTQLRRQLPGFAADGADAQRQKCTDMLDSSFFKLFNNHGSSSSAREIKACSLLTASQLFQILNGSAAELIMLLHPSSFLLLFSPLSLISLGSPILIRTKLEIGIFRRWVGVFIIKETKTFKAKPRLHLWPASLGIHVTPVTSVLCSMYDESLTGFCPQQHQLKTTLRSLWITSTPNSAEHLYRSLQNPQRQITTKGLYFRIPVDQQNLESSKPFPSYPVLLSWLKSKKALY